MTVRNAEPTPQPKTRRDPKSPSEPESKNPHAPLANPVTRDPLANPVKRAPDQRSPDEPIKHRYTPREDKGA